MIKRLLKFLDHNERQYVILRSQQNYSEAISRLERLSKLIALIHHIDYQDNLTHDDANKIFGIQRHLKALGFCVDEPPSYVHEIALNSLYK